MAYDPAIGKVVLFGGAHEDSVYSDTWTWSDGTWTELSPAVSPNARNNVSLAYDPQMGELIAFGGSDIGYWLSDTWAFNGTTWTEIEGSVSSSNVGCGGLISYDQATNQLVLFAPSGTNDTYIWSGSAWVRAHPSESPPGGCGGGLTYDAASNQLVLFAGWGNGGQQLSETWSWGGSNWHLLSSNTGPSPRGNVSLTYDAATGQLVLFGGESLSLTAPDTEYNQTWIWQTGNWQLADPPSSPSERSCAAMTYDASAGDVLLFGGVTSQEPPGDLGDTWIWQ